MQLDLKKIWIMVFGTLLMGAKSPVAKSDLTVLALENRSSCRQPKAPGLCRGRQLRYAFNKETGNCESFYYTGCASTQNNFMTFEECRRDCMQKMRY